MAPCPELITLELARLVETDTEACIAMDAKKLPEHVLEALVERGHSPAQIGQMSAERVFDEYCGWIFGNSGWGSELRAVLRAAQNAESV